LAGVAAGAVAAPRSGAEVAEQVERMVRELFEAMSRHRVVIMVLDRCAADVPELAGWFDAGRYAVADLWDAYLGRVADHIGDQVDRSVLARTIVEVVTL
jgi:hypothetical protein